jgi:uncharacterized Zn finger protein
MSNCPRCQKNNFRTFVISRYNYKMPVNKCSVCGYLWIDDKDLKGLAKAESKKMFIETLRNMGKIDREGKNNN